MLFFKQLLLFTHLIVFVEDFRVDLCAAVRHLLVLEAVIVSRCDNILSDFGQLIVLHPSLYSNSGSHFSQLGDKFGGQKSSIVVHELVSNLLVLSDSLLNSSVL